MHEQQRQTLDYFRQHAKDWQDQVKSEDPAVLNTLLQRYEYVVSCGDFRSGITIDLGCGSGDLSIILARRGMQAHGIDFSPEMIALAKSEAKAQGAKVDFVVGGALDPPANWQGADLTTALGLIEYLSQEEIARLFALMKARTKRGGQVIVESRNRLFNLVSLNAYTEREISSGSYGALLRDALRLAAGGDWRGILHDMASHADMNDTPADLPRTGIPFMRHQFTPGQVAKFGISAGMVPVEVCGYHYHALPPAAMNGNEALHAEIARAVQPMARAPALLAHFSSLMMRFECPA